MVDILFVTRGRGRGHAVRDLAIASELSRASTTLNIAFASYDRGFAALAEAGVTTYDLELPERNAFPATVLKTSEVLRRVNPRIVVAHEEPAAVLAAALHKAKVIFSTNWFSRLQRDKDQALEYARQTLFMEDPGLFAEPEALRGRIHYCGPVLRRMNYDPPAAMALRACLGLSTKDLLISVLPGSPSEAREPIFDMVYSAFVKLGKSNKRLIWVAGADYNYLSQRIVKDPNIIVVEKADNIDSLMTASQLIITKGTYNITKEAMAFGRTSISLSHGHNWVDDLYAAQCPNNVPLSVKDLTPTGLALRIDCLTDAESQPNQNRDLMTGNGARRMAEEILNLM